tara:strand:- start:273 stop:1535 length:1263 start_codon:yes stop_codon:yes gene_type:complete
MNEFALIKRKRVRPQKLNVKRLATNGDVWQIHGSFGGVVVRKSSRTDDYELACWRAKEIEDAILEGRWDFRDGVVVRGKEAGRTFRDAADKYLDERIATRGRPAMTEERMIDQLAGYWGDTVLSEIDEEAMDAFVVWLSRGQDGQRLAPGSVRRKLNLFSPIMKKAVALRWLERVPNYTKPKVDDERDVHYEVEEVEALLDFVRAKYPWAELNFLVLVDAGLRWNEACALQCRDVTKEELVVRQKRVDTGGHGKTMSRRIPLSTGLREYFDRKGWPSKTSEGLLKGFDGGPINYASTANLMRAMIREASEELGIPYLRIHDLRHTFAFLAAQAGADLGDLQTLMGHKRIEMTMRYRGHVRSRAESAIKGLRVVESSKVDSSEVLAEALDCLKMVVRTGGDSESLADAKVFLEKVRVEESV